MTCWNTDVKSLPKDRPCLVVVDEDWGREDRRRAYHVTFMLGSIRVIGGNFAADLGEDKIVAWAEIEPFEARQSTAAGQ